MRIDDDYNVLVLSGKSKEMCNTSFLTGATYRCHQTKDSQTKAGMQSYCVCVCVCVCVCG